MTSEDFKPLTQQIGPTSRCKEVGADFNLLANHK
jgi:hypothetical protein